MGFEFEVWQDADEGSGTAAGDLAFALVLGALVEVTGHAEVAVRCIIDQVDAEGVVGDVEINFLLGQISDHPRTGFAHPVRSDRRGDTDGEVDVGAFVIDANISVTKARMVRDLLPQRQGDGTEDPHLLDFWHRGEMTRYGAGGVTKTGLVAEHALVCLMDLAIAYWSVSLPVSNQLIGEFEGFIVVLANAHFGAHPADGLSMIDEKGVFCRVLGLVFRGRLGFWAVVSVLGEETVFYPLQ